MRVGIIGYGYWGDKLVRNVLENGNFQLIKIADTDPSRLKLFKKHHPHIASTLHPGEIINDKSIDCIIIATNPSSLFELGYKALEKGKHVLIEKPVSSSPDKIIKLKNLAEANGLTIMADLTFLYNGVVRKIKEIVDDGYLGKILFIDSTRVNFCTFQGDINVLWDLGTHDVSIINYLLGDTPVSLSAIGKSHYFPNMENIAYLNLYYPDDILVHIHCNWPSPVKIRQMRISGDKKSLMFDDTASENKIKIYNSGYKLKNRNQTTAYDSFVNQEAYIPEYDTSEALKLMIEDFYQAVSKNKKPLSDMDKMLDIVKILETAQQSMDMNGKKIKIK
ncbi:MAG: Gfo/Idh/MocA family protein [Bacteroidota bacterium]